MNIIKLQGGVEKRTGIYYEYDIDSTPLGEGGMGRVFKGYRVVERTGERTPVAIKMIYENIPEQVIWRARREASIQLDHENLIRMFGFVETETRVGDTIKPHYHVVMELLIGVTLEDIINGITSDKNGLHIPSAIELYTQYSQNREAAVIRIMKAILSGLMALHDSGYIHRDIDPSNIMVTIDGKIKLIDFGICKQIVSLGSVDKALTEAGVFMGKVNYAAPELVLGDVKNQNYTTDIYALGVLMYQLYTGNLPFSGTNQEILSAHLRQSLPMGDIHKRAFKKIIRTATEKVQSKRYSSVAEFRVDIDRISITQITENHRKWGNKIILGISAALILIIGYLVSISDKNEQDIQPTKVYVPTNEELYEETLQMMSDSITRRQGIESLRILAEDTLYVPAQYKYYTLLLNSNKTESVEKGYNWFRNAIRIDPHNNIALFECGLTLSKGNSTLSIPLDRQRLLGIKPNLVQANEWLIQVAKTDSLDYKSVYWVLNNLIEMKLSESNKNQLVLPPDIDYQIIQMHSMFEYRIQGKNDNIAELYKEAIADDKILLYNWNLID